MASQHCQHQTSSQNLDGGAKCIAPPKRPYAKLIAIGSSALLYIDKASVTKVLQNTADEFQRQGYDIEIRAYKRLGLHPRIVTLREVTDDGLKLERGECVRRMAQNVDWERAGLDTKLRWAQDAADGLQYIKSEGYRTC